MDDVWEKYISGIKLLERDETVTHETAKVRFSNQEISVNESVESFSFQVSSMNVREFKNVRFSKKLDLHGDTLAKAERRVTSLLQKLQISGEKNVIIITGKGKGSAMGQGVLNTKIPELFQRLAHLVIGYSEARIEDGGRGAFYVRIRKYRPR